MEIQHQPAASSQTSTSVYERVLTKLKTGYKVVYQAQTLDAQNDTEQAKHLYYQASSQLTRALSIRCGDPRLHDEKRKASFVLNMIKERIRELEDLKIPQSPEEDAADLSHLLDNIDEVHTILEGEQETKEVLSIDTGISVFNVQSNGEVNQVKQNAQAKIKHIISSSAGSPISCLQIGDLIYPLISKASPVLQVGERQFMLPSLEKANKYIGVVLENVDEKKLNDFQRLMMSLTNLQVKSWDDVLDEPESSSSSSSVQPSTPPSVAPRRPPPPSVQSLAQPSYPTNKPYLRPDPPPPRTVDKISDGIQVTAELVSAGLVWGSKVGGNLIRKGANSLKGHIKPSTNNVEVSDHTKEQVKTIRESTYAVSVLTGQAVSQLATGIAALARLISPHVTKGIKTVINSTDNKLVAEGKNRISQQTLNDVCQLGVSGLSGLATLYEGLEEGAKQLGRALAEGANVTVGQRYGADAGQLAEDGIHSVTNIGLTYSQARKLTGKAIAKKAAKSTAKEVVVAQVKRQ